MDLSTANKKKHSLLTPDRFFLIPETKGIPLERMDELFDMRPTHRAHSQLLERMRDNEDINVVIRDEKARAGEHKEMA